VLPPSLRACCLTATLTNGPTLESNIHPELPELPS
jgi:hypothetical protein